MKFHVDTGSPSKMPFCKNGTTPANRVVDFATYKLMPSKDQCKRCAIAYAKRPHGDKDATP